MHDVSCFVTLTYDPQHVPEGFSLNYRDFQLFMKRLRKRIGRPVRFFCAGEYGSDFQRPHFHCILFGWAPDDQKLYKTNKGNPLYTSALLDALWQRGFTSVGRLTRQSAQYCAKYCLKKVTGKEAELHYQFVDSDGVIHQRTPEFVRMSLKPGIGATWYDRFHTDVTNYDRTVVDGKALRTPKYYDKLLKRRNPDKLDEFKALRVLGALPHRPDNTAARLSVKEQVTLARLNLSPKELK